MKSNLQFTRSFFLLITTSVLLFLLGNFSIFWLFNNEYALEANYLYRFTQYITWPSTSVGDRFDIGFLGDEKGYENMRFVMNDKTVKNQRINVSLITSPNQLQRDINTKNYQIVFITQSFKSALPQITQILAGRPTLIVSEEKEPIAGQQDKGREAIESGVHAKFLSIRVRRDANNHEDYLVYQIDRSAVEKSGLKISNELLNLSSQSYLSAKHKQELAERDLLEEIRKTENARLKADSARKAQELLANKAESERLKADSALKAQELIANKAESARIIAEAARREQELLTKEAEAKRIAEEEKTKEAEAKAKQLAAEKELVTERAEKAEKERALAAEKAERSEKERLLAQANEEKEKVKADLAQAASQRNLLIFSGIAIILSIVSLLIYRSRQLQKLANSQLAAQNEEILAQRDEIERQKAQVETEREKSEKLLLNILPLAVAEELKSTGKTKMRKYDRVSVLFTDFKRFSEITAKMDADTMVEQLNDCFEGFDRIIAKHRLEKIKTIGDAYMCAGGVPEDNFTNPADAVLAALEMQKFMKSRYEERKGEYWQCRLGINTGAVRAGVIGTSKFAYDIWGETVNIASRMESGGNVEMVNISEDTYSYIKDLFECEYRGEVEVKNGLMLKMYFVHNIKKPYALDDGAITPNHLFWEKCKELGLENQEDENA
jgi:class 3 adenylate cyclase